MLSEAVLINVEAEEEPPLALDEAMRIAWNSNLDVSAETYAVDAGSELVRSTRANLRPQLSLSVDHTQRKVTQLVRAGQATQRTTDSGLSLVQPIYVDDAWAGYDIQRSFQTGRERSLEALRLDIVRDTAIAYLNVLRAKAQLRVQRDNLNLSRENLTLARDRVRAGAATEADRYRWEIRLANARGSVQFARAEVARSIEAVNRLLNRPITRATAVVPTALDDALILKQSEYDAFVTSPRRFDFLTDFVVEQALDVAPELQQLDAQHAAKEREVSNLARATWLPDFVLSGQSLGNLHNSGVGSDQFDDSGNWLVGVTATLPLVSGGGLRADRRRAQLELEQIDRLRQSTRMKIEQRVRSGVHQASASFAFIALSDQAARASSANLDLVTDAYAKGVVSVIDLLDAQNASLQADEASANAAFDFLVDMMEVQRASGVFDLLNPPAEREARARQLRDYVDRRVAEEGIR